ncbi:polysaccharide deacetylase [Rhizobium sp. Root1203]|uniref:polysaccharide deacetylase family protein n=1 Tax=Rhizobium sp. Root1203 TaxID=1736427 RepID=UPI00070F524A|nr:polysaccharide deacetylase family protein [Rhizobium sp. Root1203]KQV16424.1 polysaccharide deacetylase [Rhizobium sp. Root1203]
MQTTKRRIINFHGIGEHTQPLEPGEADYWLGLDRFCYVLDRIAAHPDRELLSITFDDGNISDILLAAPQLMKRGLDAEFFVLTGRIGRAGSVGADDIRSLMSMGMRIGSHGIDHRDWSKLPAKDLDNELNTSKKVVEEICGCTVRSAAIPFGRYNARVLSMLRNAGYEAAYSSDKGSADTLSFLKPRTSIRHDTTDGMLGRILAGHMPALSRIRRAAGMTMKVST